MKNYFKRKLEIWKLCHAMEKLSYQTPTKIFSVARNFDFKGYTNPCDKPNENTLPPPVGVPSCRCNDFKKEFNAEDYNIKGFTNPYHPDLSEKPTEPTIPMNPRIYIDELEKELEELKKLKEKYKESKLREGLFCLELATNQAISDITREQVIIVSEIVDLKIKKINNPKL